jgi:hypothetical protein
VGIPNDDQRAFAGVIFAVSFTRTARPDRAFGFNVAGAMAGGLAENMSMLVGFQYLVLIAAAFYALSTFTGLRRSPRPESEPAPIPTTPTAAEPALAAGRAASSE